MDILELLSGQLDSENVISQLSKSSVANSSQVQQAIKLGVPALLQALGKNASSLEGAFSLAGALDNHRNDNIGNVEDFLKNVNMEDGSKILNHIFSGKNQSVQSNLAKKTGLETNQVSTIMNQLAPLLMGAIGQQKASKNVDAGGIANMLTGFLGSQSGKNGNIMDTVSNLLDADDDGSIIDDVGKIMGGFFNKK